MNTKPVDAIELLKKHYCDDTKACGIVTRHSELVAAKAVSIARRLTEKGIEVDVSFVEEAAMLHDIGVSRTNAPGIGCFGHHPYIRHGILGREILEQEGLERHALVCERHIGVGLTVEDILAQNLPLPHRDMSPQSIEERIVCFADLFYSKKWREVVAEKTVEQVRQGLEKFGAHKIIIFDRWHQEFKS